MDECRREYWSLKQLPKESVIDMAVCAKRMTTRYCNGCTMVETVAEQMALGRFLSVLPPGIAAHVRWEKPKTTTEAARMADTITKDRAEVKEAYWNKPKDNNRKPYFERKDTSPKPESSHVSSNTMGESEDTSNADSGPFSWMKCYGCGQKGHKRSECPKKVLRIITPKQEKDLFITGKVGKHTTHLMKVDTGAQVTVVHPKLINDEQYTGKEIGLNLVELGHKRVPVATAQLEVGELEFKLDVAVLDIAPDDVLLGMDIGKSKYMVDLAHKQAQQTQEKSAAVLLTRNQKKKQQDQSAAEEKATEDSGAQLNDIFQFDDQLFTMLDPAVNNCSDLQEEVIPLPVLADDEDDKRVLIDQQRMDGTLAECRQKADSQDKGYIWKDELLVHTGEDVLGQTTTQIVLPVDRRKTVLEMAYSSLLGGHLGTKKTKAIVNRHFTWPGLGKDVATWCKACERCQLTAKHSRK